MQVTVERRMFERVKGDFAGRYSTKDAKDSGEVWGLDVGGGGIGVRTNNKIPEDKTLELWLFSPQTQNPIYTTGRVAWQREVNPGEWRAGLKFYKPNLMQLSYLMAPSSF